MITANGMRMRWRPLRAGLRGALSAVSSATMVVAAIVAAVTPRALHAQRGGRFPDRFTQALGDPGGYYTPPDFHGNPKYDGRFTFARIKYRGYDHWAGREGPGWSHDYPDADEHLMKILREVTRVRPFVEDDNILGGAIIAIDDPLLLKYPVSYLSEPGGWHPNATEVAAYGNYIRKGGFIIFDDDNQYDFQNLIAITNAALPGLRFQQLKGDEAIFDAFFKIDTKLVDQQCMVNRRSCYRGIPKYWALFEDNNPKKRMLLLANVDADIGEFWQWSGTGFAPVDVSNEAYKLGVNYIVYALTHP